MSKKQQQSGSDLSSIFPYFAIPLALVIGVALYVFVLGNPSNFEGGDPIKGHPLNVLGTVHKGGIIVSALITVNLVVLIFAVERFISLQKARGKGSVEKFIREIRAKLNNNEIDGAIAACDRQRGSVAAVLRAGLTKYKSVQSENGLD